MGCGGGGEIDGDGFLSCCHNSSLRFFRSVPGQTDVEALVETLFRPVTKSPSSLIFRTNDQKRGRERSPLGITRSLTVFSSKVRDVSMTCSFVVQCSKQQT